MKKLRHSATIRQDFEETRTSLISWFRAVDNQLTDIVQNTSLDLNAKVMEIRVSFLFVCFFLGGRGLFVVFFFFFFFGRGGGGGGGSDVFTGLAFFFVFVFALLFAFCFVFLLFFFFFFGGGLWRCFLFLFLCGYFALFYHWNEQKR